MHTINLKMQTDFFTKSLQMRVHQEELSLSQKLFGVVAVLGPH